MSIERRPIALVTGGAGFIGSHLCQALLKKNYIVRCFDDLSYGSKKNVESAFQSADFEFVLGDVCDLPTLEKAADKTSIIFHLAARKIPRYGGALLTLKINNEGTKNILELADRLKLKVILASTSDVYGKGRTPFAENDDLVLGSSTIRRWSYAASKIFDEHLALAYFSERGVPVVVLRFFGSYGPSHHRSWWGGPQSVFIDQALKEEAITIHGDGSQTRSFIYVEDLVEGILSAAQKKEAEGQIINLGSDEEISILKLAGLIYDLIRPKQAPNIKFISFESFGGKYEDVRCRIPNLEKAKSLLKFQPKIKLVDGLSKTIRWHMENPV